MSVQQSRLTDAQEQMIGDLDDVAEHVAWEFDADEYDGFGACGFAHIKMDGRCSFSQRVKSLASSDHPMVEKVERGPSAYEYQIHVGRLQMSLNEAGNRLSITNVSDFRPGPEHQRIDVRIRLHELVLHRLQSHGYLDGARIYRRMD